MLCTFRGNDESVVAASQIEDLYQYKFLNYEKLKGDKKGISSLRINNQYRLEFRELVNAGNQTFVEICSLIDITNLISKNYEYIS